MTIVRLATEAIGAAARLVFRVAKASLLALLLIIPFGATSCVREPAQKRIEIEAPRAPAEESRTVAVDAATEERTEDSVTDAQPAETTEPAPEMPAKSR